MKRLIPVRVGWVKVRQMGNVFQDFRMKVRLVCMGLDLLRMCVDIPRMKMIEGKQQKRHNQHRKQAANKPGHFFYEFCDHFQVVCTVNDLPDKLFDSITLEPLMTSAFKCQIFNNAADL